MVTERKITLELVRIKLVRICDTPHNGSSEILLRISFQLVIISVLPLSAVLPVYYSAITMNFYYKQAKTCT